MRQFFASMSRGSRLAFAAGLLLIVAVVGGAAWWIAHPPYGVLFGDLRQSDAAEITSTLGQMQVPYRLADEGKTILVPNEQVYETRMKLAAQGVPKGGSVGFELFKDSDYGVTEFAQKVNFQRALQGELERTIDALDEVASSRVHLTIRHTDLFEHDQEASKASVTLSLRPQKHIDARGIFGIQRLVASAVEGLSPESVAILDDKGTVLSGYAGEGQAGSMGGDHLDQATKLETEMRERVGGLLQRVLQTGNFTVSVAVRLNYDHVKHVSERLIAQGKDGNGLLVHEKIDSTGRAPDNNADPDHAVTAAASSNDRDIEYAHGREQEEVDQAPGRIERISVGVVVPSTLSPAEVAKLPDVISAALGLDPARGDKVDIAAIAPPESLAKPASIAAALPAVSSDKPRAAPVQSSTVGFAGWIVALLAVLVAVVIAGISMTRRPVPRRLTLAERQEALSRVRRWIETAEGGQ
jgi:flagellar M-ring protein FliF